MEKLVNKMILRYKFKIIGEKKGFIDEITINTPYPEDDLIQDLNKKYDDTIFLVDMEKIKLYYQMTEEDFMKYGKNVTEERLRSDN